MGANWLALISCFAAACYPGQAFGLGHRVVFVLSVAINAAVIGHGLQSPFIPS